jgi:hypothetical protein
VYSPRTPGYSKHDPAKRWALPDRVFFACGACHVLAEAFLERFGEIGHRLIWIKPKPAFWGNHIFIRGRSFVFDYHGCCDPARFIAHERKCAMRYMPGWDGDLIDIPRAVLTSDAKSREIPGLWLMEPGQFLHDALPRARRFLDRFGPPP